MATERVTGLELGLYSLCVAAPFAIGSPHALTQIALAIAALVLLVARLLEGRVRVTPVAWVMLAALAWTALQLVPLPSWLVHVLSPRAYELRTEVGARFAPLTLDVAGTALELVKQVGYVAMFLVATEVLRTSASVRRAAIVLGLLGAALALTAIAHQLVHADRIFGFYAPRSLPGVGFFAPFVNRNNAAALLAMCALVAAGLAFYFVDERARLVFALSAIGAATATLATTSRGGAIGLATGAIVLAVMLAVAHYGSVRGSLFALALVALLIGGSAYFAQGLRTRFSSSTAGNTLFENQKTRGWVAALRLANRYPIAGVGRGAFEAAVAETRVREEAVRLIYPENVVCQLVSEWGWPAGVAFIGAALAALVSAFRRCRREPITTAMFAGVVAVAVHDLFDYSLELPGVAFPFLLALGCIVARSENEGRAHRRARTRLHRAPGLLAAAIGGAMIVLGLVESPHTLENDVLPIRALIDRRDPLAASTIAEAITRHPASAELEILAGEQAVRAHDGTAMHHLNRAMRLQPSAPLAHHLAAIELARSGRRRQAALEYRLARERGENIKASDLVVVLGPEAIEAVGTSPALLEELARDYAARGRWDDVDRALDRARQADGGPEPRALWLRLIADAPRTHRLATLARLEKEDMRTGDDVAELVEAYAKAGAVEHAEALLRDGLLRYPGSARLFAVGARAAMARGDLAAAQQMLLGAKRFDRPGRILIEQARADLAEQQHDPEALAAARARLRLLRAGADIGEPARGGSK